MDIDKVIDFLFPIPPEAITLAEAERCLEALGALNSKGGPTPLRNAMAHYPFERNLGLPYLSYCQWKPITERKGCKQVIVSMINLMLKRIAYQLSMQ